VRRRPRVVTLYVDCFSRSYAEARSRFLGAAAAAGLEVGSHVLPLPGADGEELAMDVALLGAATADRLLIVSSACHGIEGYAGSAAQLALLQDPGFTAAVRDRGLSVLFIHGLNPHGFSWGRRVTGENVDLNRNFIDFSRPLPVNVDYERLAPLLIPDQWPPPFTNGLRLALFVMRHGLRAAQAAVSRGQYVDARGLFFGGHAPTWSNRTLRQVLREMGSRRSRIAWVDVHTGLGRRGGCERMLAARHDADTVARSRAWWGRTITSTQDESSSSPALHGQMWWAIYDECPQAEYTGIAVELGTASRLEVLHALRAEQWLGRHPDAPASLQRSIRNRVRSAFYVERAEWKRHAAEQAIAAVRDALDGLAGLLNGPRS
jgi:hypothetical protein